MKSITSLQTLSLHITIPKVTTSWMLLLLLSVTKSTSMTVKQSVIMLQLVEYFQPDYLDILANQESNDLSALIANQSFPARKQVLTSVCGAAELMTSLSSRRGTRGGFSLVIAEYGSEAWNTFTKIADSSTLQKAKWVVFSAASSYATTVQGLYIPFDCQLLIVNMAAKLHIITEVYNVVEGGPLRTAHFGYWDPRIGLSTPRTEFYQRRPNFQGATFTAFIKDIPPYTYVTKHKNGTTTFGGYFYEVWKELEHRLKFKTEFTIIDKAEKVETALTKNNFMFYVSPVWQDPRTIHLAGLSQPIYEPKIHLFGRRPGSELEWNSYLKPFSTYTWLTLLAWLLGSSLALTVLYYLAWTHQASEPFAGYYVFTLSVSLETVFRAACGQGSDVAPKSLSCRVMFLSIYMTALVVTSAFSAALFSLLTVPRTREPFYSFRDVYQGTKYRLGIIPDTDIYLAIKDFAERHPKSDRSRIFRMLEPQSQLPRNEKEALERICQRSEYIFMWDLPNVQLAMQNLTRSCQERIMAGGPMVSNQFLGFATYKANPYKGLIDLHLVRMKNEGVVHRLLSNTWPPSLPSVQTSWVRVTISDISPILYMFCLGVILGVIFLLIERIHVRGGRNNCQVETKGEPNSPRISKKRLRELYGVSDSMQPSALSYTGWKRAEDGLHHRYKNSTYYN